MAVASLFFRVWPKMRRNIHTHSSSSDQKWKSRYDSEKKNEELKRQFIIFLMMKFSSTELILIISLLISFISRWINKYDCRLSLFFWIYDFCRHSSKSVRSKYVQFQNHNSFKITTYFWDLNFSFILSFFRGSFVWCFAHALTRTSIYVHRIHSSPSRLFLLLW